MISSVILVFVLYRQVSAHEFLYSEMEYLGGSCYPRDSCTPARNNEEDHLWGDSTCECGIQCIRYGTCCADSPHYGKSLHVEYRGEVCHKPPKFSDAIVLVTRCSDRWHYGYPIKERCESGQSDFEDPVMEAPVTSLDTNVTYKNYFCAICNYDTANTFTWIIRIGLPKKNPSDTFEGDEKEILQNATYDRESKSWGVTVKDVFYKLNIQFKLLPHQRKFVKKCYPGMISRCSSGQSYELQYKCSSYYAPVSIERDSTPASMYRNIHCAACNNVNASEATNKICKLPRQKPASRPSFSFSLLLDINKNDGESVGEKEICKENEKWDPFFNKCRSLVCAFPGYVVKDGKCVKN